MSSVPPPEPVSHEVAVTSSQLLAAFGGYCTQYRRLRTATVTAYLADVTSLLEWCMAQYPVRPLEAINSPDLREYLQAQTHLSNATMARRLNGLRSFFRFLCDQGLIAADPTLGIRAPRVPKPLVSYVTDDGLRAMLGVCHDAQEQTILLTLAHAGLRRGELVSLEVGDVDLDGRRLVVREGKGGSARAVPIVDELAGALRSYLQVRPDATTDALFLSRVQRRLTQTTLQRMFGRWLRDAGLKDRGYTLHSLRHGAATRWLRAGLNIRDVQVLLGHESIETTARYLHADLDLIARELQSKAPAIIGAQPATPAEGLTDEMKAGLALLGRIAQMGSAPALGTHVPDDRPGPEMRPL